MLVCKCSCGEEWQDKGDGLGVAAAWRHRMDAVNSGESGAHKPIGVFDEDTGELVQNHFIIRPLQLKGLIPKRDDSSYTKSQRAKEKREVAESIAKTTEQIPPLYLIRSREHAARQAASQMQSGQEQDSIPDEALDEAPVESPRDEAEDTMSVQLRKGEKPPARAKPRGAKLDSPVRGKVTYITIDIPADLWFLFLLSMRRFPSLEPTSDHFSAWIAYCVFKLHIMFPNVFGLKETISEMAKERGVSR